MLNLPPPLAFEDPLVSSYNWTALKPMIVPVEAAKKRPPAAVRRPHLTESKRA